jgi:hypothetical protein
LALRTAELKILLYSNSKLNNWMGGLIERLKWQRKPIEWQTQTYQHQKQLFLIMVLVLLFFLPVASCGAVMSSMMIAPSGNCNEKYITHFLCINLFIT